MKRFLKHLPKIILVAALCMLIAGIIIGEPEILFNYAVSICLNCIGIG